MSGEQKKRDALNARIESREIIEQKSWKFIQELNSFSEERLDSVALVDGKREYTYRQMFRRWENYAEVFSALGITEENHSRVGMLSTEAAEPTMLFYALNMTGASVSMISFMELGNMETWKRLIEKEGITDLVLCDSLLQPGMLHHILRDKRALGIRSVIVVHVRVAGPFATQWMKELSRTNYQQLKRFPGALFMDELLEKYEAAPIVYSSGASRDDAIIIHTSGTTNGVHKPIPLSDRAFNEAAARLLRDERFQSLHGSVVSCLGMELAASYSVVDMMHLPFAFGGKVITMPMGQMNPQFPAAIQQYRINVLFAAPPLLDTWMNLPTRWDLSSLKLVWVGGSYVSPDAKQKYNDYLKQCGADARISIGYGLAEIGAACIVSSSDRDDDAIGYPLSGVQVKIFDENEEKYFNLEDGPRTGVLFLSSLSLSSGRIDNTVFFELDEIDGETYLNTYDLVTVNEDGSLKCVGRMNKYFVNNEGIRFDAGLVETAVGAQPSITACGLAPTYDKIIHDTIPVLYVQTRESGANALNVVRQALCKVFIHDNKIAETNLPGQCVLTDSIPFTATGKVDVYQIVNGGAKGTRYMVKPVRKQGKLLDIRLVPITVGDNTPGAWAGVPDELAKDVDFMNNMIHFGQNGFQPPQGFPMPFMPSQGAGNQPPQGWPMPNMPIQGMGNQPPQGWPMPNMPIQGMGNQPPQGWPVPNMPIQGMNCQPPQGWPMPNMPIQGMNCQPPQGWPMPNMPIQGMGNQPPQGWPVPNMPMQGMNCQPPVQDTQGENSGQAKQHGMQKANLGPIMDLLAKFFNASNVDYFFED